MARRQRLAKFGIACEIGIAQGHQTHRRPGGGKVERTDVQVRDLFRRKQRETAAPGDYTLAVNVDGPIDAAPAALYQTVKIGPVGSRTPVNIPITATGVGNARLVASLAGPANVAIDQSFNLGVLPANPLVTRRVVQNIAPNGGGLKVNQFTMIVT